MKLDRLKKIYFLHSTKINVKVPSNISNMTDLIELDLYFTYLHGNIPSKFGLLKYLCYLGMDKTHSHGNFPSELDNMHHIK